MGGPLFKKKKEKELHNALATSINLIKAKIPQCCNTDLLSFIINFIFISSFMVQYIECQNKNVD